MTIKIELVTPSQVEDLQAENRNLREELKRLQGQHNALHETVYRFMENFTDFKRSLKNK